MTPEEIKRAREICDEAMYGPWHLIVKSFGYQIVDSDGCALFTWKPEVWNDPVKGQILHPHQKHAVAVGAFIAEARTLLPKALDALENLKWEYENVCKFATKFEEEVQRLKELLNTANKPKITLV